jgi:peptidoglycan/xylan/chitin deacetylase (PgdA/CDA1 family)
MLSKIKLIIKQALIPKKFFLINESTDEKKLYLTFDDGPVVGVTEPLLALLAQHQAKATFFIIGQCAEKQPELMNMIHQAEHTIANHSYSHPRFNKISHMQKWYEITKTNQIIKQSTGTTCALFRAPQGRWDIKLVLSLFIKKMKGVHWSRDSRDFKKEPAAKIVEYFHSQPAKSGDIILFHDDDSRCIEALKTLIPYWQSQGFNLSALENK